MQRLRAGGGTGRLGMVELETLRDGVAGLMVEIESEWTAGRRERGLVETHVL